MIATLAKLAKPQRAYVRIILECSLIVFSGIFAKLKYATNSFNTTFSPNKDDAIKLSCQLIPQSHIIGLKAIDSKSFIVNDSNTLERMLSKK